MTHKDAKRTPAAASSTSAPLAASSPALHNQLTDPDGFYEALLDAHEGLAPQASAELNARLILILANQIGDQALLMQCVALAKK